MSLRHALLAILTAEPMTGYDLVKYFDGTVTFLWSAPHTQIYPELRRMEQAELVTAETVPRGQHAKKRVYRITERGTEALRDWLGTLEPVQPERDPHRLRSAFFEWSSYDMARRQLQEHLSHYWTFREERERLLADMKAQRVPLLRHRLERRSPDEHRAIVAFKEFAFEGEIARATAEIEWAEKGLALVDELERSGAPIVGSRESVGGTARARAR